MVAMSRAGSSLSMLDAAAQRLSCSVVLRRLMSIAFAWLALALAWCGGALLVPVAAAEELAAGPLYDRFRLTLEPGERTEVLGPLLYIQEDWADWPEGLEELALPEEPTAVQEAATTLALPPLFSCLRRPSVEGFSWDFLYPLMTYDRYGEEYKLQVAQLLSFSGGQSQAGAMSRGFSLFPLLFFKRSDDPKQNYSAVLPFYGHTRQRLFRDEVRVVLWPLYAQTRKKDIVTDNVLVPFFHLRHGEGLQGWQFWPLIGREHKEITSRTNLFGEAEPVWGHDRSFVLWPLFFHNTSDVGSTNAVRQRVLLPFYSLQLSPAKDTRTYLWPLGPTVVDARAEGYRQVGVPWPLIVFARGEGKTTDRLFPLYSHSRYREGDTTWVLWPLFWQRHTHGEALERDLVRFGFFLYTDITDRNVATGQTKRRTDVWPLLTARRDFAGNERFQLGAPIEAILPGNPSVARNWSPLWSLWRSETNARTGAKSESLLWNLYRSERAPGVRKCSLLFGLIQYEAGPDGARWRWLHLFGGKRARGTTKDHVSERR